MCLSSPCTLWNLSSQGQNWFNWKELYSRFLFWPSQHSQPYAQWPSGEKKNAFLSSRKESNASACLECVYYWHCSPCLVSVISTWIFSRFCLLMKTNSAAQGCVSSAQGFTGHSPVLLYNLFPFSIKRCWIQLWFIVFMTTTLILFFFSFSQTKKCSEV